MKYLIQKLSVIGFLLTIFLLTMASCGSTEKLAIYALEPSEVALSNHIVRVGVLDTDQQPEEQQSGSGLDRLVFLEDRLLVKKGRAAALQGLIDELQEDNRYEVVELEGFENKLGHLDAKSMALSSGMMKDLCKRNSIDALFSLTGFDAETNVSLKKTKMRQANMMREKVSVAAQELTLETLIQNGWIIYDPFLDTVIDEYTYNQQFIAKAKGIDALAALRAIGSRKDSILQKGKRIGNSYGARLKPQERKIVREYFVKGTENFVQANSCVDFGDMQAATKLWEKEVNNPKLKISGRACHNLAVAKEYGGELELARVWASKTNQSLNIKNTTRYLEDLDNRIAEQAIVKAQLEALNFDN